MVSAIWSMPPYEAKQMPLTFFLNFSKIMDYLKLRIDHNGLLSKIEVDLTLKKYWKILVGNITKIMR